MELMITLAVVAILATIAVPNMRTFIQNSRLTSSSNDLLRSFQLARSEAIKRQQNVVVCASANPTAAAPTCSYGPFTGWIVFQDGDITAVPAVAPDWQRNGADVVIERHELIDSSVTVKTDNDGIESYAATGFAIPAGGGAPKSPTHNIVMCDVRGNQTIGVNSVERAVLISTTGRARVSTTSADVSNALGKIGGGCP